LSAADALLIFIDDRFEVEGWLCLADGVVAARGPALEGLPPLTDPQTGAALRVAAVVPGEAVALHWLEVPAGPGTGPGACGCAARRRRSQPAADRRHAHRRGCAGRRGHATGRNRAGTGHERLAEQAPGSRARP
jgi:hypothetical protein